MVKYYIKNGDIKESRQISVPKTIETEREVMDYEPIEGEYESMDDGEGRNIIVPKMRAVTKTEKIASTIRVYNPSEEDILADGWEVYVPEPVEPSRPNYEDYVDSLIRERYSVSEEFAILRQRDTKLEEYAGYYAYCEECKSKAKKEYEKLAE